MEVALGIAVIVAIMGARYWVKYKGSYSTHCPYCRMERPQRAEICPHCHKTQPAFENR